MKRIGILLLLPALTCSAENLTLANGTVISNVTIVCAQPATVTLQKDGKVKTLPAHDFKCSSAAKFPMTNNPYATIIDLRNTVLDLGKDSKLVTEDLEKLEKAVNDHREKCKELVAMSVQASKKYRAALDEIGDLCEEVDRFVEDEKNAGRMTSGQYEKITELMNSAYKKLGDKVDMIDKK